MNVIIFDVSIIVPIYNVEKYIYNCLESVGFQNTKNCTVECVLIDDCCTDNSIGIVKEFISKYNGNVQFTLISHPVNKGLSAARNTGLNAAKGKYVYFLDSDDTISHDCIESLFVSISKWNSEMVIGENYIFNNGEKKYLCNQINVEVIDGNGIILKEYIDGHWYNVAWNKLIRTDFLLNNELYFKENLIFEDELWSFIVATKLQKISIVKKPTYNYFIRNKSSIMDTHKGKQKWERYKLVVSNMRDYIVSINYIKSPLISEFYNIQLLKLIRGYSDDKQCSYKDFRKIHLLSLKNLKYAFYRNRISLKQYVAWYYLQLPCNIGFVYYRSISLLSKTIRILRNNLMLKSI